MMSTVGIELMNFINPDLTWKTVSKGNRSTTRRSRKLVGKSFNVGSELAGRSPNTAEDASVSESEKQHGVAVLGRRFGDKVEHVPIKKRRFLLQSTSPSPTPSSHLEESGKLADSRCYSGWRSSSDFTARREVMVANASTGKFGRGVVDGKIPEVTNEKFDYDEDFSGIEILAAAACNNSIGDDFDNAEEGAAVEEFSTQDGIDSSSSAMPLKENVTALITANMLQKDLIHEDLNNSAAVLNNLPPSKSDETVKRSVSLRDDRSHWDLNIVMDAWEQPCDGQILGLQENVSEGIPKDAMDVGKLENSEVHVIQDSGDAKQDTESTVQSMVSRFVSEELNKDTCMLSNSGSLDNGSHDLTSEEHNLGSAPDKSCFPGNCVIMPTEHTLESSISVVADEKTSTQIVSEDACFNHSPSSGSDHFTRTLVPEEQNSASVSVTLEQKREDCASDVQVGEAICSKGSHFEKHDFAFTLVPVSENTSCIIDSVLDEGCENPERTYGLHHNSDYRISPSKTASTESCEPLGPDPLHAENPVNKSDEVGAFPSFPGCENLSASGASVGEGQHVEIVDVKGQDEKASVADTVAVDSLVQAGPEELISKSSGHSMAAMGAQDGFTSNEACKSCGDSSANHSGKIDLEDPLGDSFVSNGSHDNRDHIVVMENDTKLQDGYDSQMEDGEFRESVAHCWVENETEDGEAERLDYGSDNGDTYDFDPADHAASMSGKVEVGTECEKKSVSGLDHVGCEGDQIAVKGVRDIGFKHHLGGSLVTNVMEEEFGRRGSVKASNAQLRRQFTGRDDAEKIEVDMKVNSRLNGGTDKLTENFEQCVAGDASEEPSHSLSSQAKTCGWNQLRKGREISADVTVEVNDGKAVGSRASRRELLSRIEVPSSYDVLHREDTVLVQRSRSNNLDDSFARAERETNFDKSMGKGGSTVHMHDRRQGSDHWVDHSVDYWDSKHHHSFNYYGPYDSGHPGPKSVIVNSKGVYRRLIRRSPTNRDEAYIMPTGIAPVRDISTDRSRGRSGRYAQGVGRGSRAPRDGYPGPVPDDTTESRLPHHVARRERSFSPIHGRGAPHYSQSRKKSRSRSRTRSPRGWLLSRERNVGLRRLSRSPDFRSEARMERVRLPFQKPSFTADYETGFVSPPRSRFSPQHNSRWIDHRDFTVDHFRDRRSPVRMFRQSQRFDSMVSSGRLKADDYYRPMIRPGRFPEIATAGRGRRYEGRYEGSDDDRRKHGDKYEMIHQVRHYERDGVPRRFRYDAEDAFGANNYHDKDDCIRGTDRRLRDIPRRPREEKGHPRYNQDRIYNPGTKSFGMRDYEDDASPRRGRPL